MDIEDGRGQNNVTVYRLLCEDVHIYIVLYSKPKTHRGKQFLDERTPKLVENAKKTMFVKGTKTSEIVTRAMTDFVSQKQFLLLLLVTFSSSTC